MAIPPHPSSVRPRSGTSWCRSGSRSLRGEGEGRIGYSSFSSTLCSSEMPPRSASAPFPVTGMADATSTGAQTLNLLKYLLAKPAEVQTNPWVICVKPPEQHTLLKNTAWLLSARAMAQKAQGLSPPHLNVSPRGPAQKPVSPRPPGHSLQLSSSELSSQSLSPSHSGFCLLMQRPLRHL